MDVNSAASSLFGSTSNPSELFAKTDTSAMFNTFKEMAEKGIAEISAAASSALDADGEGDANNLLFAEGGVVVPQKDGGGGAPRKQPVGKVDEDGSGGEGLHSRQAFEEEITRVKDLVKAKDGELAKLSVELQDARDALQAEKEAQAALRKELKDNKAADKVAAVALDAKIAGLEKEAAQLRDTAEKHQKVAADRSADADALRKQLEAVAELKKDLKTAKAAEKALKDGYEDKVNALERDNADLRDELSSLRKAVDDRTAALAALQGQLAEAGERMATEVGSQDANVAQLQQERTAAKVEAAQHLEQLKQAQDAVSALEKKLDKSKALHRKVEDKLKAIERDRQTQEDEAKTAAAEAAERAATATDRVTALEAELASAYAAQAATQALIDKVNTEAAERATKEDALAAALAKAEEGLEEERAQAAAAAKERDNILGRLRGAEAEVAQLKSTAETLQEARGKQSSETMSMAAKMDELTLKVKKAEEIAAAEKAKAAVATTERDDARSSLAGKEDTVTELQGKLTHLAEKLKDVMKKYAEAKASLQSVEQGKESELMSLRLKLENAERGTGDQRAMAAELADRYGETQRELSRAKTAVQEHLLTIESLQRDLRTSEENAAIVAQEKASALDKLQQEEDARAALERRVGELMDERESVEDKLRSGEDSAKVLEEYKKRAQLALKKANTASSQAAAEVGEMRRSMEEAQARAVDAEEAMALADDGMRVMRAERDEAVALATQLKKDHAAAVEAEQVAAAAAAQALARLRDANEALAARPIAAPAVPAVHAPSATAEPAPAIMVVPQPESNGSGNGDQGNDNEAAAATSPTAFSSSAGSNNNSSSSSSSSSSGSKRRPQTDAAAGDDDDNDDEAESDKNAPSLPRSRSSLRRDMQHPPSRPNQPDGDTMEFGSGVSLPIKKPSSDKLVFVNELYSQIDELRREVTQRGLEIDAGRQELALEVEVKKKLATRVEELMAFLDRSKKFQQNDPDSATNTEYLKNCVYRFMATTEFSERRRLAPVICTILKLTTQEKKAIEIALVASENNDIASIGTMASTMATSTLGSLSLGNLLGWSDSTSLLWGASDAPAALLPEDSSLPVPGLGLRRGRNASS